MPLPDGQARHAYLSPVPALHITRAIEIAIVIDTDYGLTVWTSDAERGARRMRTGTVGIDA